MNRIANRKMCGLLCCTQNRISLFRNLSSTERLREDLEAEVHLLKERTLGEPQPMQKIGVGYRKQRVTVSTYPSESWCLLSLNTTNEKQKGTVRLDYVRLPKYMANFRLTCNIISGAVVFYTGRLFSCMDSF